MFHWKDIFCWTSVLCDTEQWLCWKQLIQKKWVWRGSKYIKSEGLIHVGHGLSVFLPLSSTSSSLDSWTPLDLSSLHFLKNLVVAKQKPVSFIFLSLDLELKWCERLNFTFRVLTGWDPALSLCWNFLCSRTKKKILPVGANNNKMFCIYMS